MRTNKAIVFAAAAVGVLVGDLFYLLISRKKQNPTNFQRFLLGTGFVYMIAVLTETVKFFLDYYVAGFALQGYRLQPNREGIFYRLFGDGAGNAYQYPLYELDHNFIAVILGGAVGGAALLALLQIMSRSNGDDRGLFYGAKRDKIGFAAYAQREYQAFTSQVGYPEYFFWWAIRIAMAGAIVYRLRKQDWDINITIMCVNLGLTFLIAPVRALFFKKLFFGCVPYRVQTYIDVFIFVGSFLGHGCGLAGTDFDKAMHVVSGGLCVLIGYELLRGTREGASLNKRTVVAGSAGFSTVVIVVWEVFEFFSDFFMKDSYNQNPLYDPSPDLFFFRIFGRGADNPGQTAVLDTGIDIVCALFGCAVCVLALAVYLRAAQKRSETGRPVPQKARRAETAKSAR